MPITLVETPASALANTFGTLAEADAYFVTRLGAAAWIDQGDAEIRKAALATAARRISAEIYRGNRVSADQALAFPRSGLYFGGLSMTAESIPLAVKHAQYEEALALLTAAGPDALINPAAASGLEPFSSLGVGDIRLEMRDGAPDDASRALSAEAYRLLRGWIITSTINAAPGARNVRLSK